MPRSDFCPLLHAQHRYHAYVHPDTRASPRHASCPTIKKTNCYLNAGFNSIRAKIITHSAARETDRRAGPAHTQIHTRHSICLYTHGTHTRPCNLKSLQFQLSFVLLFFFSLYIFSLSRLIFTRVDHAKAQRQVLSFELPVTQMLRGVTKYTYTCTSQYIQIQVA